MKPSPAAGEDQALGHAMLCVPRARGQTWPGIIHYNRSDVTLLLTTVQPLSRCTESSSVVWGLKKPEFRIWPFTQPSRAMLWCSTWFLGWSCVDPSFQLSSQTPSSLRWLVQNHIACLCAVGRLPSSPAFQGVRLVFSCCPWNVTDLILGSADHIQPQHSYCWRHMELHLPRISLCPSNPHLWWLHLMVYFNAFALDCRDFMENGLVKMCLKWLRTQTLWTNVN